MDATQVQMDDDTNEWEEEAWREPVADRTGRLLQAVISLALVAIVAFAAGLAIGGKGSETPRGGSPVVATATAETGDDRGDSCAGLPGEAWKTQLCPSPQADADDGDAAHAEPEELSPSCAGLPISSWREQLCPFLYLGELSSRARELPASTAGAAERRRLDGRDR